MATLLARLVFCHETTTFIGAILNQRDSAKRRNFKILESNAHFSVTRSVFNL